MKKFVLFWIVLAVAIPCTGYCYEIADSFQYPLSNYTRGENVFGEYNLIDNGKYHLGEDAGASAGDSVYAIADGVVSRAQSQTGYGGMYIIEHELVSGNKLCSLYAHMNANSFTKNAGAEVQKGDYLGQIGNVLQNGGYPEHIHFGVRKGPYPDNPNAVICNDWIFSGYTACSSVLDDWHDPSDFINNQGYTANSVLKFANHPEVYLVQKNQLWPISSERAFALLGYNNGSSCTTADWDHVIELPEDEFSHYQHLIRSEVIPSQNLMVKIADEVGPSTCRTRDADRYANTVKLPLLYKLTFG